MNEHTPLEIVRKNLYTYTPRRPETTEVVLDMMTTSLVELGEDDGLELAERLCAGLDPSVESPVRFGLRGAELAARVADQACDTDLDNGRRVGGLAVISAMSLLYRPRRPLGAIPPSAEAIGAIGRGLLARVSHETRHEPRFNVDMLAQTLMWQNAKVDPESLAIELFPLVDRVTEFFAPAQVEIDPDEEELDTTAPLEMITPGEPMPLADIKLNAPLMDRMDWLNLNGVTDVQSHAVAEGGKVIAYVADFTTYHEELYRCRKDIEDVMPAHFRNRLAQAIIGYHKNRGSHPRINTDNQKVPTYYASSGSRNERLLRIYFTPVGVHVDGTPVIGLLAAARTKDRERQAMSVISVPNFAQVHVHVR